MSEQELPDDVAEAGAHAAFDYVEAKSPPMTRDELVEVEATLHQALTSSRPLATVVTMAWRMLGEIHRLRYELSRLEDK